VRNDEASLKETRMTPLPAALAALQTVSTDDAAKLLHRKPNTLRAWARSEAPPLQPVRINGRLLWPASGIVALLSGQAPQPMATTIPVPTQRANVR
jgi:hypothetical protein